jgi:hypothetical protein
MPRLEKVANDRNGPTPIAAEPRHGSTCKSSSARTRTWAAWAWCGTRRAAASRIRWPSFAEKVRRTVPGNFTFVLMTDRDDLDGQIYRTFIGCDVADEQTPRASSGRELQRLLSETTAMCSA